MRIPGSKSAGPERVFSRDFKRVRDRLFIWCKEGKLGVASGRSLALPIKGTGCIAETRAEKVERIRVALANGAYRVDGKTVAAKMVDDVLRTRRRQEP